MLAVRRIILFFIFLLIVGCTPQPEQTIVDRTTGNAVAVPVEPEPKEPDTIEPEPVDPEPVEPVAPATPEPIGPEPPVTPPDLEKGVSGLEKGTAGWAVDEAFKKTEGWASDPELFAIRGFNLFDGKIKETFDLISDIRVYQGYYVVTFTSESNEFRELLEVTVNWEGASDRIVKKFLPEEYAVGYRITGWNIDTDELMEVLEGIKEGAGYSVDEFELQTAGLMLQTLGLTRDTIKTPDGEVPKNEIYQDIDPLTPICTVIAYYNVAYDIDCSTGELIGFYGTSDD